MNMRRCGLDGPTSRRVVALTAVAAALLLAAIGAHAQAMRTQPEPDVLTLHHRFTMPPKLSWGAISIDLRPGAWRVGHPNGPAATEAQLRAMLGNLAAVEIGGRCAGWVEGSTAYPCGFAVAALDFAGSVADRFAALAVDLESPDPRIVQTSIENGTALHGTGLIAPMLDATRLVTLKAPQRYHGDRGKSFGGRIAFKFRAVSNPLVPSLFERASGTVILRAAPGRPV